jgi:hypothetical protein
MMDDDLDYVYVAPVICWRGGRVYQESSPSASAPLVTGHAEGLPLNVPRITSDKAIAHRRSRPAKAYKVGQRKPPVSI